MKASEYVKLVDKRRETFNKLCDLIYATDNHELIMAFIDYSIAKTDVAFANMNE